MSLFFLLLVKYPTKSAEWQRKKKVEHFLRAICVHWIFKCSHFFSGDKSIDSVGACRVLVLATATLCANIYWNKENTSNLIYSSFNITTTTTATTTTTHHDHHRSSSVPFALKPIYIHTHIDVYMCRNFYVHIKFSVETINSFSIQGAK